MGLFGSILAICALVFLFHGEPDVWDNLHAKAMETTSTATDVITEE